MFFFEELETLSRNEFWPHNEKVLSLIGKGGEEPEALKLKFITVNEQIYRFRQTLKWNHFNRFYA